MMLATFIVMLAAFNLSPRTDIEKQQIAPMAEASVTKFLVQHDSAVKYAEKIRDRKRNGGTGFGGSVTQLTGCNASKEGDLCPYLPMGYKYEENAYYSSVYCLNGPSYDSDGKVVFHAGQNTADCMTGVRFVITFGRVPQRWKNVTTNRVLAAYYKALRTKVPLKTSGGIVVPKIADDERNTLNSKYVIQGFEIYNNSIPPYFIENDNNFKSKCTKEGSLDSNFPCVIFVSRV